VRGEVQDADPYHIPSAAALTTRRALSEASTSTVGRVAFVLLIAVVTSGCANYSFNEVRRSVTRTELPRAEAERAFRHDPIACEAAGRSLRRPRQRARPKRFV